MNCLNIADLLDSGDYLRLSAAGKCEVDAHLEVCTDCRAAFRAHEAMRAMAVPAMSASLAAQCRELVVAKPAGRNRRPGGQARNAAVRPYLVAGLLVAGAAAAAFVGLGVVGESGDDAEFAAEATVEPQPTADVPAAAPSASADVVADTAPSDGAVAAVAADSGFTVAVTPINIAKVQAAGVVYRSLLDELREIPDLDLIELEAVEFAPVVFEAGVSAGTVSFFGPAGGAAGAVHTEEFTVERDFTLETNTGGVASLSADGGSRTLVLVDTSTVDRSNLPTALVGRIEAVTGGATAAYGAEAMEGVVNVVLNNSIEGVRVDLAMDPQATGSVEPMAYDYQLEVTATPMDSADEFHFDTRAQSRNGTIYTSSAVLRASDPAGSAKVVEQFVAALRDTMFPVDESNLDAISRRVKDTSLPFEDRLRELERLRRSNRSGTSSAPVFPPFGVTRLADDVALAVVDMLVRANDMQRSALLSALRGVDNAVLVQPLSNILRNDLVPRNRLEAVFVLASYQHDPFARAALEAAATSDPGVEIRQNARWAALDVQGRRNLVVSSLIDTRLSDAERVEPLLLEANWAGGGVEIGSAIDATVANELTALLRRSEVLTQMRLIRRLDPEDSAALAPLFIERLNEDESEVVRGAAASALFSRLDEPGVRPALERAAASDPSMAVRQTAGRSLNMENLVHSLQIGN